MMSIDLSLYLTQAKVSLGYAGDEDIRLASCRATMPVAWWCFFAPEEIITGPYGPMMRAKASDGLERLRAQAPRLRAAAGRHARGLRRIERTLEDHPDWWLEAYVSELYYGCSLEGLRQELVQSQAVLGTGTLWATLQQGRFVRTDETPTQELADHIVGHFEPHLDVVMSWDELQQRAHDALIQGDASELDLLEEALFRQQREQLGGFDKILDAITPARHISQVYIDEGTQRLERWIEGDESALDFLETWQLPGLLRAAQQQPTTFKMRARKRLKGAKDPISGLIAQGLRLDPPASRTFSYVRWERGDASPIFCPDDAAVLACRLVAAGAPSSPLCLSDPIALAERALFTGTTYGCRFWLQASSDEPWEIAINRALQVTQSDLKAWLKSYGTPFFMEYEEDPYESKLFNHLSAHLPHIKLPLQTRQRLLSSPEPEDAALSGPYRSLIRLALGDESQLELFSELPSNIDKCPTLDASGLSARCVQWLDDKVERHDLYAAVLLAEAQAITPSLLSFLQEDQKLRSPLDHYHEGLITPAELEWGLNSLSRLYKALTRLAVEPSLLSRLERVLEEARNAEHSFE